ncbi:MAG: nucleoid-associated protein, YbaB/EbfC family [Gammaproteobacteria bacterium RIFCSPHIGHO2_12_FULL_38_11]|nr:MAG: nucleoid-associated protein, YbaB/EbfC family [Gammaproteobacteria bacterium RIFCSPHIGHO2_12_FULL_38_11]
MFGDKFNLGNIANLMKNAGKIKEMMSEAQEKLAKIEVTGESGAGVIQIKFNAQGYALDVMIDDDILKEDKAILLELIAAAINDGAKKIEKVKEEMLGAAGGMLGGE